MPKVTDKKDVKITVRISQKLDTELQTRADQQGIKKGEYIRRKLEGSTTVTLSDSLTIEEHIDKLGHNLVEQMQAQQSAFVESAKLLKEQQEQANKIISSHLHNMGEMIQDMTNSLSEIAQASAEMRKQNAEDSEGIASLLLGWKNDLALFQNIVDDLDKITSQE